MRKKFLVFIGLLILFGLLFLSQILINPKNYAVGGTAGLLSRPFAFFTALIEDSKNSEEFERILRENEALKAELLLISQNPYPKISAGHEYVRAKIYSTYPFNNRDLIALNAGAADGLSASLPVTVEGVIFLGQLIEVADHSSITRTIFDAHWELPVKIGTAAIDALLVGGREPRLTLILKEKELSIGEDVYSAGKDFPYGLKIGTIREIFENPGSAFKEASLDIPYDLSSLGEVSILIR